MANFASEPKVLGDCSRRTIEKIGEINPRSFEPNKAMDMEIESWKRKKSEKWHVYIDSKTGHLRKSKEGY